MTEAGSDASVLLKALASDTVPAVVLTNSIQGRFSEEEQFYIREEIQQQLKKQQRTFRNVLRTRDEKIAELRGNLTKSEWKQSEAVGQAEKYVQMQDKLAANRLCKRFVKHIQMREQALTLREWGCNMRGAKDKSRGQRLMARAGRRMMNLEKASFLDGWKASMQQYKAREHGERQAQRMHQLQLELDEMTLKFNLTTNAAGEKIMRNVAQRILNKEAAAAVIVWRLRWTAHRNQERAEGIMRRVAKRILHRDVSDALMGWREAQVEETCRKRGEAIMRRVGGRMKNKELALNWQEWYRNFKADIVGMWRNRMHQLQLELDEMTLKYKLTKECWDDMQTRIAVKHRYQVVRDNVGERMRSIGVDRPEGGLQLSDLGEASRSGL